VQVSTVLQAAAHSNNLYLETGIPEDEPIKIGKTQLATDATTKPSELEEPYPMTHLLFADILQRALRAHTQVLKMIRRRLAHK